MKIAIITDYPSGIPYGGLQTHVYYLLKHLSKIENVEIHVIVLSSEDKYFEKNKLHFHHVKRLFNMHKFFTVLPDSWKIKKRVNEINPDIVHVQGTHYPYNYIARIISSDYPTVLTVHGLMSHEYEFNKGLNYLGGILSLILEKYAFKKVKDIIVCSKPMQIEIEKLSRANIYLIPNGIDLDDILSYKPLKSVKHPSILYMGLLENIKGVDVLIKAAAIIKEDMPDINVYIAGEGSQGYYLKQLSKNLNLDENVKFLGYLDENKYSYLKAVDICAVPSRYESFGIIILEAIACETPIIASNVGNIPFLLNEDFGFIVEPDDVESFARMIQIMLTNSDLMQKIKFKSTHKIKEYQWDTIVNHTLEVYKRIIKQFKNLHIDE